ncbi:unnamed protein product, partial [Iphiclides podalirius]
MLNTFIRRASMASIASGTLKGTSLPAPRDRKRVVETKPPDIPQTYCATGEENIYRGARCPAVSECALSLPNGLWAAGPDTSRLIQSAVWPVIGHRDTRGPFQSAFTRRISCLRIPHRRELTAPLGHDRRDELIPDATTPNPISKAHRMAPCGRGPSVRGKAFPIETSDTPSKPPPFYSPFAIDNCSIHPKIISSTTP